MAAKWIEVQNEDGSVSRKLVTEVKVVETKEVEMPEYLDGVQDVFGLLGALHDQGYSVRFVSPGRNTPKGGLSAFYSLSVELPMTESVDEETGEVVQSFPTLKIKDITEEGLLTDAVLRITEQEASGGFRTVDRDGLADAHKEKLRERAAAAKAKREAAEEQGSEWSISYR